MKLHYAGKYSGNLESLPKREHHENSVQFKEPDDMKKFAVIINILGIIITAVLVFTVTYISRENLSFTGIIIALLSLIPHEFLHALCFKKDVYMYNNLKHGMMFVVGTEDMSKSHFIFMSLCPNIVFGFIPFAIFLIFPNLIFFGTLGALAIGMGAGDYLNVFYTLTQVPKGAKVYNSGFHSYWYK